MVDKLGQLLDSLASAASKIKTPIPLAALTYKFLHGFESKTGTLEDFRWSTFFSRIY